MITLSKSGNTITFTFDENSGYLQNGAIEVPLNSLSLITDESDMATFRKSASNDIFVSARYEEFGMSKSDLETWYKNNMVGSTGGGGGGGVTPQEVEEMIDEAVSGKADSVSAVSSAEYVSSSTTIDFKNIDGDVISSIDASAFVIDGMIDDVRIDTISGETYLVIDFNTASGKEDIEIPISDIFDADNYYTKNEVDSAISAATDDMATETWVNNQGFLTEHQSLSAYSTTEEMNAAISTATSGKQDTIIAGDGINIDSANTISTTFEGYFPVQDLIPIYYITDNLYVSHYTGGDDIWCGLFILNEEGIPFEECGVSINGSVTAHTFEVTTFVEDFPWEDYITIDWYDSDVLKVSKSADSPYGDGEVYIYKAEGTIANGFEAGTVTDTIKSMAKVMSTLSSIDYVDDLSNNLYKDLNDAKVNKSSVVSSVTSASTDSQIPTAKAVYASISAATSGKQNVLTAGDGIYIDGDTIKTRYRGWSSDFTDELTCQAGDTFELVAGFDCEGSTEGDAIFSFDEGGETVTFHFHFNSANETYSCDDEGWEQYFNIEYYDGIFIIDPNDNIVVTATDELCTRFTQSGIIGAGSTTNALDEIFPWLESKADKWDAVNSAEYVSSSTTINFKNIYGEIISYIDASDFIVDGMVEDVRIATIRGVSYLVIDFNTASGKQDIRIPLTDIFDPSNYYTKSETSGATQIQTALGDISSRVGGVEYFVNSDFPTYTAATDSRLSEDEEVTAAALNDLNEAVSGKQDTLIAGDNITISGNVISAEGSSITIDPTLDSGSTNAVANSAITTAINAKQNTSDAAKAITWDNASTPLKYAQLRLQKQKWGTSIDSANLGLGDYLYYQGTSINVSGLTVESAFTAYTVSTDNRLAEDEEVTAAALNNLNDKFGGLKLQQITQADYDALVSGGTVDSSTLYIIV